MTYKNKILLGLVLLPLIPSFTQAYCPPYFAKIDSIEPKYDCLDINDRTKFCGGAIEIINHCPGEFYFYGKEGELDENFVLVNFEDRKKNYQKYLELDKETGKRHLGHDYRHEPKYSSISGDCDYRCPDNECGSCWCDKTIEACFCKEWEGDKPCSCNNPVREHLINGVNVCSPSEVKKAGSGTVVKVWTIKMFSKDDNQDIIVKGRTFYGHTSPWLAKFATGLFYTSISLLFIALVLKFVLKKKHTAPI